MCPRACGQFHIGLNGIEKNVQLAEVRHVKQKTKIPFSAKTIEIIKRYHTSLLAFYET
jgi:hypothetical protein